jgi:hypothetical protein
MGEKRESNERLELEKLSVKAVQGQVEAYNAKDVTNFLSWYTQDVIGYDLDENRVLFSSVMEMIPIYTKLFENKALHCDIKQRMILGTSVIDFEQVIRNEQGDTLDAIAIYDVREDGLIQSVRFTRGRLK